MLSRQGSSSGSSRPPSRAPSLHTAAQKRTLQLETREEVPLTEEDMLREWFEGKRGGGLSNYYREKFTGHGLMGPQTKQSESEASDWRRGNEETAGSDCTV